MSRPIAWITRAVGVGLVGHIVLTAFENSPDAKVSFGTRGEVLARLPQWRFFAPTPGVDNTHLMFRTRSGGRQEASWSDWEELPLASPINWLALLWNPGTRGPKALFDCAQHIRMMSTRGVRWEEATNSPAYVTMQHAVQVSARERGGDRAQFMIVATRVGDTHSVLQPLMVSEAFGVEAID